MTRARLKLVICPSCKGTGKSYIGLLHKCAWCIGERRIAIETAMRWIHQVESLAYSGYLCGDHSEADMHKMRIEAMAVRTLIASFGGGFRP
jgi:hypothetical protein